MLKDFKEMLKSPELKCTNCGKKINEGDSFTANLILPSENKMLVGRLDKTIARTAESVFCKNCH